MNATFVDTSALYAAMSRRDAHHAAARNLFRDLRAARVRLVTSDYVVDEAATLMKARFGSEGARRSAQLFSGGPERIHVVREVFDEAAALFLRYADQRCSFTDCTTVVLARRLGIGRIFAFDDDFRSFEGIEVVPAGR